MPFWFYRSFTFFLFLHSLFSRLWAYRMHVTFSSPSFYLPFLLLCGLITLSPLFFFLPSLSSPLWTYHTFSSLLLSIFPFFPFFSYADLSHFPLSPSLPTHLLCEFITPFPLPSLPCLFVSNLCHFINFILLYSVLSPCSFSYSVWQWNWINFLNNKSCVFNSNKYCIHVF